MPDQGSQAVAEMKETQIVRAAYRIGLRARQHASDGLLVSSAFDELSDLLDRVHDRESRRAIRGVIDQLSMARNLAQST